MKKKARISIRVSDDLAKKIECASEKMNITKTALIERAILAYENQLDRMIKDKTEKKE